MDKKEKKRRFNFVDLADEEFLKTKTEPIEKKESKQSTLDLTIADLKPTPKYEVNYDDLDNEEETKSPPSLNDNETSTLTFNQASNYLEKEPKPITDQSEKVISESKKELFWKASEKLQVKTNIYLKPTLVHRLKSLEKELNMSRSAIINKLLEYALENIKE